MNVMMKKIVDAGAEALASTADGTEPEDMV